MVKEWEEFFSTNFKDIYNKHIHLVEEVKERINKEKD